MSILGAVYYREFAPAQYEGNWVKEERYEYCDGFGERTAEKKSGILERLAAALAAVIA